MFVDHMGTILSKENTLLINLTCLILTELICSHVPSDRHIPRVKNYVCKMWTSTTLKYISCKRLMIPQFSVNHKNGVHFSEIYASDLEAPSYISTYLVHQILYVKMFPFIN